MLLLLTGHDLLSALKGRLSVPRLSAQQTARARSHLDSRLSALPSADDLAVPVRGWVAAIRTALGMSASDLAARLGVTAQSVQSMETGEVAGTASLRTLRRAAEAMDCDLVYALIPRSTLADMVHNRAALVVDEQIRATEQTMRLEDQSAPLDPGEREDLIGRVSKSAGLWSSRR